MFSGFLSGLGSLFSLLALGASLGVACGLVTRIVGGLSGYGIAAAAGAVMLVGAHWGGVLDQNAKQKIADLEAANEQLEATLKREREVHAFEQKQAAEEAQRAIELEEQYRAVLALIDKHKNDSDCISAEELKAIGDMK
jgi:hypothetical protein